MVEPVDRLLLVRHVGHDTCYNLYLDRTYLVALNTMHF